MRLAEEASAGQEIVAMVGFAMTVGLSLSRRPESAQSLAAIDLSCVKKMLWLEYPVETHVQTTSPREDGMLRYRCNACTPVQGILEQHT